MKAFDTDILTEVLAGNPAYVECVHNIPLEEQSTPIVAVEKKLRGRLNMIRQAEAGKTRRTTAEAYRLLDETLDALRELKVLSFTPSGEALFKEWGKKKIRVRLTTCGSRCAVSYMERHWHRETGAILNIFQVFPRSFGSDEHAISGRRPHLA